MTLSLHEVRDGIAAEHQAFAALLRELDGDAWARPSRCACQSKQWARTPWPESHIVPKWAPPMRGRCDTHRQT